MEKEYTNGEITVVWQNEKCIHSTNCFKGLSKVFDPKNRPWVQVDAASSDEIMKTIDNCPSGALSYYKNSEGRVESKTIIVKKAALSQKKNQSPSF